MREIFGAVVEPLTLIVRRVESHASTQHDVSVRSVLRETPLQSWSSERRAIALVVVPEPQTTWLEHMRPGFR